MFKFLYDRFVGYFSCDPNVCGFFLEAEYDSRRGTIADPNEARLSTGRTRAL